MLPMSVRILPFLIFLGATGPVDVAEAARPSASSRTFLSDEPPGSSAARNSEMPNGYQVAVDWDRIKGNWKQFEGKIREKWGKLTDDDLEKAAGRREYLEGRIQERYGLSKDEVRKEVDDWLNKQQWD